MGIGMVTGTTLRGREGDGNAEFCKYFNETSSPRVGEDAVFVFPGGYQP